MVLEQDPLLDGLEAALARQTAGDPRDALEIECYKAALDFVLNSLTPEICRTFLVPVPANRPIRDQSEEG